MTMTVPRLFPPSDLRAAAVASLSALSPLRLVPRTMTRSAASSASFICRRDEHQKMGTKETYPHSTHLLIQISPELPIVADHGVGGVIPRQHYLVNCTDNTGTGMYNV